MRRISTKRVQDWQHRSGLPWLEGVNLADGKMNPKQYWTKFSKGDVYYWKLADSYVFAFENATTCISRGYFEEYFKDQIRKEENGS